MSDIGAIFHVKKAGVQYDAHAYTTLDECPYPNLKIRFNGTNAFVKLENRGNGDVPLYVKMRSGEIYQVKKEAIPTGSIIINRYNTIQFTVPSRVSVVMVTGENKNAESDKRYIGVTPGKTYPLYFYVKPPEAPPIPPPISILKNTSNNKLWNEYINEIVNNFIISWSPEINKKTPNITDY